MAGPVQLTPEQKAAIQAFAQKHPGFNYDNSDPFKASQFAGQFANGTDGQQAFQDFQRLKQQLGPVLNDAHFGAGGTIEPDLAWWKQALLAAGVVAAPGLAYAALPAAGAPLAATATDVSAGPAATLGAAGPLAANEAFTAGPIAGSGLSGVDLAGMTAHGMSLADVFKKLAIPVGTAIAAHQIAPGVNPNSGAGGSGFSPELQQMLAASMQRMSDQEPLFHAINQQAYAGLPNFAKKGGG